MVSMSSCYAIELWMCSRCVVSSPLRGKVLRGLRWSWYLLDGLVHVSLSLIARCALNSHSVASNSPSMHSFFIPFVIAPCSINVHVPAIHSWRDDIKSKIPYSSMMHCFWFWVQVTEREDKTLKLCREQLRLGWGAPEYCQEKLCRGHWEEKLRN